MKFLEGLKLGAFVHKAKLKATLAQKRWATIELAIGIYQQRKDIPIPRAALADEILAAVPAAILKAYKAMEKSQGATLIDFDLCFRSQNLAFYVTPDRAATLEVDAVDLSGLRLEMADPNHGTVALYFSFVTELTDDIGRFLCKNLGSHIWLAIEECQAELHEVAQKGAKA